MLEAIKDFNKLCIGSQMEWIKKHPKGYCMLLIAAFLTPFAMLGLFNVVDDLRFRFRKVFRKKEEDEK